MEIIRRTLELENGNKVNFTAGPRYPFWTISFEKGGVPAELSGMYQYYDDAVAAVKKSLQNRYARNRTKIKED